jgi:hypothetical protein
MVAVQGNKQKQKSAAGGSAGFPNDFNDPDILKGKRSLVALLRGLALVTTDAPIGPEVKRDFQFFVNSSRNMESSEPALKGQKDVKAYLYGTWLSVPVAVPGLLNQRRTSLESLPFCSELGEVAARAQ